MHFNSTDWCDVCGSNENVWLVVLTWGRWRWLSDKKLHPAYHSSPGTALCCRSSRGASCPSHQRWTWNVHSWWRCLLSTAATESEVKQQHIFILKIRNYHTCELQFKVCGLIILPCRYLIDSNVGSEVQTWTHEQSCCPCPLCKCCQRSAD